jgi:hypothetical protein
MADLMVTVLVVAANGIYLILRLADDFILCVTLRLADAFILFVTAL